MSDMGSERMREKGRGHQPTGFAGGDWPAIVRLMAF